MNPKWKLGVLFLLMSLAPLWFANAKRKGAAQKAEPDYKDNNAVRKQTDEAFIKGTKVRDGLRKRLGAE